MLRPIDTAKISSARARARGRVSIGGPQGGGSRKEHHPGSREIPGEDRYTKRAVTLYIGDGEACERASEVPPHAVKINGTIAIYLVSHDNKR